MQIVSFALMISGSITISWFIYSIILKIVRERKKEKEEKVIELDVQDYETIYNYFKGNKKYIKRKFKFISLEDKYTYCDYCGERTKSGKYHKKCLLEKYHSVVIE